MAAEIRVVAMKQKDGRERAQIKVGTSAQAGADLAQFNEAIGKLLAGKPAGTYVICKPTPNVTPESVRPVDAAAAISPANPPSLPLTQTSSPPTAPSLLDRNNPYNFIEWHGSGPDGRPSEEDATHVGHALWRNELLSGSLRVELRAVTPVFVPQGRDEAPSRPQPFWRCWHPDGEGEERLGLPGSSVKGAVRTLYEAWTNSHLGVLSESFYDNPIPYRRRSATAWVVASVGPDASRGVKRCEIEFLRQEPTGWLQRNKKGQAVSCLPPPLPPVARVNPNNTNWQVIPYRANLFWVDDHTHRWTHLAIRVQKSSKSIPAAAVTAYEKNLDHDTFKYHPEWVIGLPAAPPSQPGSRNHYQNICAHSIDGAKRDLLDLDVGAVVFGIENPARPGELKCFGKNVNFLWPSGFVDPTSGSAQWVSRAPRDLVGSFAPRGSVSLNNADWAEAAFGFAANHDLATASHPFRGRIRFGTFWVVGAAETVEVCLQPLLAPGGTKLKSRALYLPPGEGGCSSTYDESTRLRGRKLYWHQRVEKNSLAPAHRGDVTNLEHPRLQAVAAGTTFSGTIHFDNLTNAELGALLASVAPAAYFADGARYGWKIGKGKPRGLGSVEPRIVSLQLRAAAGECYKDLAGQIVEDSTTSLTVYVSAFRSFVGGRDFERDLKRMLRLSGAGSSRIYSAPNSGQYGWMPAFENANGDPTSGRPTAMRPARAVPED